MTTSRLSALPIILAGVASLAGAAFMGCKPALGDPPSLVTAPRVLQVRAIPAEAMPGTSVMLEALVVDPGGQLDPPLGWTTCRTPKPPAESNAVSRACVTQPDDGPPAPGIAMVTIPADACTLFGPLTPPMKPGEPPARPRDPDPTGGFYQPFRVAARAVPGADADLLGFALARVTCPLANAAVEVARQFGDPVDGYHPNDAPVIGEVTVTDETGATTTVVGATPPMPMATTTVRAGAAVTMRVSWPAESAEDYLLFDLTTRELGHRRESLRVSWFTTAGEFLHDRTGRDAGDLETSSENTWTATGVDAPSTVHFWLVLGDSRGGSVFAGFDAAVSP